MILTLGKRPSFMEVVNAIVSHSSDKMGGHFPKLLIADSCTVARWMGERSETDKMAASTEKRWASLFGAEIVSGSPVRVIWEEKAK